MPRTHDLDTAVRYIRDHLSARPTHDCAKHVREGLEAAGFDTTGHPLAARDYGPFLERLGFVRLSGDDHATRLAGDVRVWSGPEGDPFGHVAMWSGSAWDADFAMHSDLPGTSFAGTPFETYRYPQADAVSA